MNTTSVTYLLRGAIDLTIKHCGETLTLHDGEAVTRAIANFLESTDKSSATEQRAEPISRAPEFSGDRLRQTNEIVAAGGGRTAEEATR